MDDCRGWRPSCVQSQLPAIDWDPDDQEQPPAIALTDAEMLELVNNKQVDRTDR